MFEVKAIYRKLLFGGIFAKEITKEEYQKQ